MSNNFFSIFCCYFAINCYYWRISIILAQNPQICFCINRFLFCKILTIVFLTIFECSFYYGPETTKSTIAKPCLPLPTIDIPKFDNTDSSVSVIASNDTFSQLNKNTVPFTDKFNAKNTKILYSKLQNRQKALLSNIIFVNLFKLTIKIYFIRISRKIIILS